MNEYTPCFMASSLPHYPRLVKHQIDRAVASVAPRAEAEADRVQQTLHDTREAGRAQEPRLAVPRARAYLLYRAASRHCAIVGPGNIAPSGAGACPGVVRGVVTKSPWGYNQKSSGGAARLPAGYLQDSNGFVALVTKTAFKLNRHEHKGSLPLPMRAGGRARNRGRRKRPC